MKRPDPPPFTGGLVHQPAYVVFGWSIARNWEVVGASDHYGEALSIAESRGGPYARVLPAGQVPEGRPTIDGSVKA
jgi:hypothetical protein